jgi:hypothetical protein
VVGAGIVETRERVRLPPEPVLFVRIALTGSAGSISGTLHARIQQQGDNDGRETAPAPSPEWECRKNASNQRVTSAAPMSADPNIILRGRNA